MELAFSRWYTIANTRFWANQSICKVWSCYVQLLRGRYICKKVHYFTFDLYLRSRKNTKRCLVSSTTYDLCTCKVWSCYVQQFRRKCIYKKYLIWPWPWGQGHIKHCPLHHVTYVTAKFEVVRPMVNEMHYQENTLFDLDSKVKAFKVTQNVDQYPWLHMTYAPPKFDVATSHGKGEDAYKKIH